MKISNDIQQNPIKVNRKGVGLNLHDSIIPQRNGNNSVEPESLFERYKTVIDLMEERIISYIYGKCDLYKELRDCMIKFFQKETDEIFQMANEWKRKIASVRDLIPLDDYDIIPTTSQTNNKNDTIALIQRLEAEVKDLKKTAQGMSDYEDKRFEAVSNSLRKVMGDIIPTNQEKLIVTTIDVKPLETRQMMVKLDLHRRFNVYMLNLVNFTKRKFHFESMRIPIDSASTFISGRFFLCGGRSENPKELAQFYISNTYEFDFTTTNFESRTPMHIEKRNHSLAGIESSNAFYSIGGYNQKLGYLSACEKYSMIENDWKMMPSLREARQDPTPCIVNSRYIYLFGGAIYSNGSWTYPLTIEYFDTLSEINEWNKISYKYQVEWTGRIHIGAAQISEHRILLFGGYNKSGQNDACFEYDIIEKTISAARVGEL